MTTLFAFVGFSNCHDTGTMKKQPHCSTTHVYLILVALSSCVFLLCLSTFDWLVGGWRFFFALFLTLYESNQFPLLHHPTDRPTHGYQLYEHSFNH